VFCDGARRTRTADLLGAIQDLPRNDTSPCVGSPHGYAITAIARGATSCAVTGTNVDQDVDQGDCLMPHAKTIFIVPAAYNPQSWDIAAAPSIVGGRAAVASASQWVITRASGRCESCRGACVRRPRASRRRRRVGRSRACSFRSAARCLGLSRPLGRGRVRTRLPTQPCPDPRGRARRPRRAGSYTTATVIAGQTRSMTRDWTRAPGRQLALSDAVSTSWGSLVRAQYRPPPEACTMRAFALFPRSSHRRPKRPKSAPSRHTRRRKIVIVRRTRRTKRIKALLPKGSQAASVSHATIGRPPSGSPAGICRDRGLLRPCDAGRRTAVVCQGAGSGSALAELKT
jgi:hypothetical protein